MTNTTRDNLIKARELLADESKWMKGMLIVDGCMCILGAIGVATGIIPADTRNLFNGAQTAVYNALEDSPEVVIVAHLARDTTVLTDPVAALYRWNDTGSRTHTEVISLLDKAIATA